MKTFAGKPLLLVVQGYSTSFHWPHFLRRKLDCLFEGNHSVEIRWATKGRTPIAKWMDPDSGKRLETWHKVITPSLENRAGRPALVLAQESLQGVFGDPAEGIRGPDDTERIEKGKAVLRQFAENLKADGADEVIIATHIYKHSFEPGIGHERLALSALLEERIEGIAEGPDVWTPTRDHYPKAYDTDGLHPGYIGAEIMAHCWFEALFKWFGETPPTWSQDEMEAAISGNPMSTLMMRYDGIVPKGNLLESPRWKDILKAHDRDGDGVLNESEEKRWKEGEIEQILSFGRKSD